MTCDMRFGEAISYPLYPAPSISIYMGNRRGPSKRISHGDTGRGATATPVLNARDTSAPGRCPETGKRVVVYHCRSVNHMHMPGLDACLAGLGLYESICPLPHGPYHYPC